MNNLEINFQAFQPLPHLNSERLHFRAFEIKDAADYFFLRSNLQVMEFMDSAYFKTVVDALKMIESIHQDLENNKGINWVICEKGKDEMIGYFCIHRIDAPNKRGEIGYALKPAYWRKGYMTETLNHILPFIFKELNFHSLEANLNVDNKNSKRLLEKIGFQKEAYFRENYFYEGKFLDCLIYGLLEKDLKK